MTVESLPARTSPGPPPNEVPAAPRPKISFEFFPPTSEKMEASLWDCVKRLEPLEPRFVSVTYGAGGSTRNRTHNVVRRIQDETRLTVAAHLTCVGASRQEVEGVARHYWRLGVRHIVALRGDLPNGTTRYEPHPEGYAFADDLVGGLKKVADFEITVAAYPETHPEALSPKADLDHLKRKIDAGATRAITQFFFDAECYFRFLDRARAAGITVPIVPGIVPIKNFTQIAKFAAACGTAMPPWLARLFEGLDEDPGTHQLVAVTVAVEHCRRLLAAGIDELHFYTLNQADLTFAICRMLEIRPHDQLARAS